ncbi:MAG: hypothetical protein FWC70_02025 [Defluviitaleaceae bacterium]|nr:hypothetical protein [Defluviitaleaceae bacterium]
MKKEIFKAIAASVLSVGLLSAAFIGFNELNLNAAMNRTGILLPTPEVPEAFALGAAESDAPGANNEASAFIPPTLTLTVTNEATVHTGEFYIENDTPIPAGALPVETAAQIAAYYIWQMFGTCIDGESVIMSFLDHDAYVNTWWHGNVYTADMMYSFIINGITGERIDIMRAENWRSRNVEPRRVPEVTDEERDREIQELRAARVEQMRFFEEIGWDNKTLDERLEFLGATDQMLELKELATDFAGRHFNTTAVVDVRIENMTPNLGTDESSVAVFNFAATDDTGREAQMTLSPNPDNPFFTLTTQHNDFSPDFRFIDDGTGIG